MYYVIVHRFHAYAVSTELEVYERAAASDAAPGVHDPAPPGSQAFVRSTRRYGGVPRGAGVRLDVQALFEELEEARANLEQVRALRADCEARGEHGEGGGEDRRTLPGQHLAIAAIGEEALLCF